MDTDLKATMPDGNDKQGNAQYAARIEGPPRAGFRGRVTRLKPGIFK